MEKIFIIFFIGWVVVSILILDFQFQRLEERIENQIENPREVSSEECKDDCIFTLQNNKKYSGWQMGCNYDRGSNADWNEQTQTYGSQMFLTCANGLDYARIWKSGKKE